MDPGRKRVRYRRLYEQLRGLLSRSDDSTARMATMAALLHHKVSYFFWTGFYLLKEGRLIVGPYQGPVACQELQKDKGVCWVGVNGRETIVVPDVHRFPGHIACDSRSKSEIVVPLIREGRIVGVLDVDSKELGSFDEVDAEELERIVELLFTA